MYGPHAATAWPATCAVVANGNSTDAVYQKQTVITTQLRSATIDRSQHAIHRLLQEGSTDPLPACIAHHPAEYTGDPGWQQTIPDRDL